MKIPRFNFGFGFFGPMEACKDGKYCLASDVELLETRYSALYSEMIKKVTGHAATKITHWQFRAIISAWVAMAGWFIVLMQLLTYTFF